MEVITIGVSQETHANSIKRTHRKRKVKRSQRQNVGLAHMPSEVLELIFVDLDPQSVSSVTSASRRFCSLGTSRFWKKVLSTYWLNQRGFEDFVGERLALSKVEPIAQIHFVSNHRFALGLQEVAEYANWLCTSMHIPFAGAEYLGLTLPHMPIRNSLARFFPDRQFYLAAYGASETNFNFTSLVLNRPKQVEATSPRGSAKRNSPKCSVPRHFFPIGLRSAEEQSPFLLNFKGAKVNGTTEAMLLAQAISALLMSVHTKGSLGRISIKIPGISSLPPPADISRFFIRSTILIARIPSLAIEFKYEDGCLRDLRMHTPSAPWEFVE